MRIMCCHGSLPYVLGVYLVECGRVEGIVCSEHDVIELLFTGSAGGCFSMTICPTV